MTICICGSIIARLWWTRGDCRVVMVGRGFVDVGIRYGAIGRETGYWCELCGGCEYRVGRIVFVYE